MSAPETDRDRDEHFAELLRRVVEEGLDPNSPEARQMHSSDRDDDLGIADRLAGSQAVIGRLERSGRVERSDLLAAAGTTSAHHAELVQRFVAERTRAPRRTPRWRWGLAVAALAAAAALLVWLGPGQGVREPSGPEIHLGGELNVHATPEGLAWDYTLSAGGWFSAVARDTSTPAARELARAARLTQPFWPLDATTRATWPAAVEIEITVFDGTNQVEKQSRTTLP